MFYTIIITNIKGDIIKTGVKRVVMTINNLNKGYVNYRYTYTHHGMSDTFSNVSFKDLESIISTTDLSWDIVDNDLYKLVSDFDRKIQHNKNQVLELKNNFYNDKDSLLKNKKDMISKVRYKYGYSKSLRWQKELEMSEITQKYCSNMLDLETNFENTLESLNNDRLSIISKFIEDYDNYFFD